MFLRLVIALQQSSNNYCDTEKAVTPRIASYQECLAAIQPSNRLVIRYVASMAHFHRDSFSVQYIYVLEMAGIGSRKQISPNREGCHLISSFISDDGGHQVESSPSDKRHDLDLITR